jgi:hypothetical protein
VAITAIGEAEARRAGAGSRDELLGRLARHSERRVFRIGLRFAGADPRIALREQSDLTDAEHARLVDRLDRLEPRVAPWCVDARDPRRHRPPPRDPRGRARARAGPRDARVQARRAQAEGARTDRIARYGLPTIAAGSRPARAVVDPPAPGHPPRRSQAPVRRRPSAELAIPIRSISG